MPVRIRIPAIGVSAPVMKLGKGPDGTVQVPPLADSNVTGWYRYGPAPGQPGSAVILGHVDSATGISVFYRLKDLRRGDRVYITLANGKVAAFAVDGVQKAAKDAFPTAAVYTKGGYPGPAPDHLQGALRPGGGHKSALAARRTLADHAWHR